MCLYVINRITFLFILFSIIDQLFKRLNPTRKYKTCSLNKNTHSSLSATRNKKKTLQCQTPIKRTPLDNQNHLLEKIVSQRLQKGIRKRVNEKTHTIPDDRLYSRFLR